MNDNIKEKLLEMIGCLVTIIEDSTASDRKNIIDFLDDCHVLLQNKKPENNNE